MAVAIFLVMPAKAGIQRLQALACKSHWVAPVLTQEWAFAGATETFSGQ